MMPYLLATALLIANPVVVPVDEPVALLVFGRADCVPCQHQYAEVVSLYKAGYPVYYGRIDKPNGEAWMKLLGITGVPWQTMVVNGRVSEQSAGFKSAWYLSDWIHRTRERAERRGKAPPQSTPPVISPGRTSLASPTGPRVSQAPAGLSPAEKKTAERPVVRFGGG